MTIKYLGYDELRFDEDPAGDSILFADKGYQIRYSMCDQHGKIHGVDGIDLAAVPSGIPLVHRIQFLEDLRAYAASLLGYKSL